MVDAADRAVVAVPVGITLTQSRTNWGLDVGRHRLSITRSCETRTIGRASDLPPSHASRTAWPFLVGAFTSVSAFGLFVFGAVASEPLMSRQHARYSVSLPIPTRATKSAKVGTDHKTRIASASGNAPAPVDSLSGPHFAAADESYVVKAMHTGEFQEWLGSDGQRRFLNTGPEQVDGDRRCRDMALLVRGPDGSSWTQSARRCIPVRSAEYTALLTKADPATASGTVLPGAIDVPHAPPQANSGATALTVPALSDR